MTMFSPRLPQGLNVKSPWTWVATWFGCGFMRPAPGTWGSLGALPFGIMLLMFAGPVWLMISAIVLFFIGFLATKSILKTSGEDQDPQIVVVDEVVGQWIALLPALLNPVYLVLAFILFRGFDALKPWPVSWCDQKLPGAWGVMMDDVVAGILAALCLLGVRYVMG